MYYVLAAVIPVVLILSLRVYIHRWCVRNERKRWTEMAEYYQANKAEYDRRYRGQSLTFSEWRDL